MSTSTGPAPTYTASKRLRIAARVTAGLVSTQLILIIGDIIGNPALAPYHGHVGILSLISATVALVLALLERQRGLGRGEFIVTVILPVLMGIQFFLSTVAVRGPHMFLGGTILLLSWVAVALVSGKPSQAVAADDSGRPKKPGEPKISGTPKKPAT